MKRNHQIQNIRFRGKKIYLIIDGKEYSFPLSSLSDRLNQASLEDLKNFKISPSGYGISWPMIDEDISVDGLIGLKRNPTYRRRAISV